MLHDQSLKDCAYPTLSQSKAIQRLIKSISKNKDTNALNSVNLHFLKKQFKDARIIALGESTHGTKEFNLLKGKIVDYLINRMGFRTIIFENDFSGTQLAQDEISNNKVRTALDSFFTRVHQNAEIENLLTSISIYNSNHLNNPISIHGCDMQTIAGPCRLLAKLFSDNKQLISRLDSIRNFGKTIRNLASADSLLQMARELYLDFLEKPHSNKTGFNIELAQQAGRNLVYACYLKRAFHLRLSQNDQLAALTRDSLMAVNIEWIYKLTGNSKTIVWAHNGHIQKNQAIEEEFQYAIKGTGAYLADHFGNAYKSYALLTYSGEVTAAAPNARSTIYTLTIADSTCYEFYLNSKKNAISFFDVTRYNRKSNNTFLRGLKWRSIGWGILTEKQFEYYNLNDKFNGIFFFKRTSPSLSFYDGTQK